MHLRPSLSLIGERKPSTHPPIHPRCLEFFADEYRLNHALGTSSIPIVSYLNGITMGGGVGLSVHGRFRVATENTVFAMPEVGIGFFPDVGGSFFLPRLRDHYGFYLALTGASIKGSVIRDVGIATHFVTSAVTVEDLTRAVHSSFMPGAKYSPAERERIVGEVLDTLNDPGAAAAAEEPSPARQSEMKEISECFSKETVEEIVEAVAAMAANKAGEEGHWSHRAHKVCVQRMFTERKRKSVCVCVCVCVLSVCACVRACVCERQSTYPPHILLRPPPY